MTKQYWVYEAEYPIGPGSIVDWTDPDPATVEVRGPFNDHAEAVKVCMGRMWWNVDKAYHRACVIDDPSFNPSNPNTHDMVVGADQYWGRT